MSDSDTQKAQLRRKMQFIYKDTAELETIAEEAFFQGDETNGYRMQGFSDELNKEARIIDSKLLSLIINENIRR